MAQDDAKIDRIISYIGKLETEESYDFLYKVLKTFYIPHNDEVIQRIVDLIQTTNINEQRGNIYDPYNNYNFDEAICFYGIRMKYYNLATEMLVCTIYDEDHQILKKRANVIKSALKKRGINTKQIKVIFIKGSLNENKNKIAFRVKR